MWFLRSLTEEIVEQDPLQREYFEKYCEVLDEVWQPIDKDRRYKAKLKGALAAGVLREAIETVLKHEKLDGDYDVSENNVYICGYATECDFLIIKKGAKPQYASLVYKPEDVVAILECKSTGIWTSSDKHPLRHLAELYMSLNVEQKENGNPQIKFGYITFSERINKRGNHFKYLNYVREAFKEVMTSEDRKLCVYCFSTDPDGLISRQGNLSSVLFQDNAQSFKEFVCNLLPRVD